MRDYIQRESKTQGECDYCEAKGGALIETKQLTSLFRNLMDIYKLYGTVDLGPFSDPLGDADELIQLVQDDWQVFTEEPFLEGHSDALLEDILNWGWDDDDGEPMVSSREFYTKRSPIWHDSEADRWLSAMDTFRHSRETVLLDESFIEDLHRAEICLPEQTVVHRCRKGWAHGPHGSRRPYEGKDVGPPPVKETRPMRANVEGQVVFYGCDEEDTAAAEMRPARGEIVTLAKFRLKRAVRIVDVAEGIKPPNPFITETLAYDCEVVELLDAFGQELGRPLERDDEEADYEPYQELSKLIREAGYDGIRYPSAMRPNGHNIVLFDPHAVDFVESRLIQVSDTSVEYSDYED